MFKSTIFAALVAAVAVSATDLPAGCHADNCYRAVDRRWMGPAVYSAHYAGCQQALGQCTSTPAATTTTATETVTAGTQTVTVTAATVTANPVAPTLQCAASSVPADMTNCPDAAAYTSACSCALAFSSYTITTATAPAPAVTATVTQTVPVIVYTTVPAQQVVFA
ncbi:hypothetical protein IAU60_005463 [Kwoniella sp. DSM 27419]